MRIILSRKGFDAENGKIPSPVMPDGTLLSFPIPRAYDKKKYCDLSYKGRTYIDMWRMLKPSQDVFPDHCHVDPDIYVFDKKRRPESWRPILGQRDLPEAHLRKQGISEGDLFLFFGWFRQTEEIDGILSYARNSRDAHMLFGYLQIGEIVRGEKVMDYPWHPHSGYYNRRRPNNNTMYIASERLVIDGADTGLPGAGTFKFSNELVLTMPKMSKSQWKLPSFFQEVQISYHTSDSWKPEGYFQSVRKGQEFVISEDPRITEWAKDLIVRNTIF